MLFNPLGVPELIRIEELVEIADRSASATVYALLKREDEQDATIQARTPVLSTKT